MPRGRPVTAHQRARILDLHGKGVTRNEIHRLTGVAAATVSKVVKDDGGTFDRSKIATAAEARRVDLVEMRSSLAVKMIAKAHQLVDDIDRPFLAFNFGGKDNTYEEHELDRAPTGDIRNLMQSASIASKESRELDRVDGDASSDERAMLTDLGRALGIGQ